MNPLFNYLRMAAAYIRLNLLAHLEYRHAFVSQALGMFVNNSFWLAFWAVFFMRFPVLRGWTVEDVYTLWAIAAGGFGLAHAICGNAWYMPGMIARGELDGWMLYPRRLLPHVILGRQMVTAWGDFAFGVLSYLVLVRPDFPHFVMFMVLLLTVALLILATSIITGSLSFYLGNAEGLAEQWRFALITFSTYPSTLFEGPVRILLFTVVPAAFISDLPIEALRSLTYTNVALCFAGSLAFLLLAVIVFYYGLRRYESGSLMEMRG
jgi:ABC-2 type transport system permease protein